ncbi:SorC family transcriptional regulator [Lactiplantibacillus fabifermentans T30PCM01]|uniref:SorC family transcriptional regulator n=2 Tax=Lactiplantibacillus fabifermentans TaxID=483011 RepID=W6T9J8_9LACO|nr:sugar-binding domain-containing protein [Lactiplantibacillus fabifermentans]ETY75134.1 SorC family transcriptional regulator [Lactiplantibacillus fabifermentans T30PCM01]
MHSDIQWIEAIAPDMVDMLSRRYLVLRTINWMAPVGRRLLAQTLDVSERTLRTETDTLRKLDLIIADKSGMSVTQQGKDVLLGLSQFMDELMGIRQKERQLAQRFNIKRCIIVSGDSDRQLKVIGTMGEEVNQLLQQLLPEGESIIAVMGGHTMEHVANHLTNKLASKRDLLFVPARGGVGESVAIQANTIASQMAQQTGGKFRSLFVPEQVSERTYEPLLKEPSIQEVLKIIRRANVVIHSIGDAVSMAHRRNMSEDQIKVLRSRQAVGEAFGYFFDKDGKVVYRIPRIGLQIGELANMETILAVAGGASKATAIEAYMKIAPKRTCLITDEGAANLILKK